MTLAKPFVKWVGGKTQLLDDIRKALPSDIALRQGLTYVEPFVGGGAVLFWILKEYPNIEKAVINDINPQLICCYRVIKENVDALIDELSTIQSEYLALGEDGRKRYFLDKRSLFNSKSTSDIQTAALFIFLNRTCFNGLYRVNSKGEFNVPFGRYSNPRICDEQTLRADSTLLEKVEILCGDYSTTKEFAGTNTIFYFDPPYRPLNQTSTFTSYSAEGFNDLQQQRLALFCEEISQKGSIFIASNSDPKNTNCEDDFFDELYKPFNIRRVFASRAINSKAEGRGIISEIMISNYERL